MLSYEIELRNIIIKNKVFWKHKVIFTNNTSFSFYDKKVITDRNKIINILVKTIIEEPKENIRNQLRDCYNNIVRAKL